MATERRLIDANALFPGRILAVNTKNPMETVEDLMSRINNAPTVDAVSRGVHDQVRWERDIAIEQLEEHGIPFGGKAPDVIKVVRCKDCKTYDKEVGYCEAIGITCGANDFCSYGERKDNDST